MTLTKYRHHLMLGMVACAAASQISQAAFIDIDVQVDLDTLPISSFGAYEQIGQFFPGAGVSTIGDGDSVSLTFDFINDRALKVADLVPSDFNEFVTQWLYLTSGSSGVFKISDIEIDFLDAVSTGGAPSHFSIAELLNGSVHLGPHLTNPFPVGSSITFTGISATFEVDYVPGGQNQYAPWLILTAESIDVVDAPAPVPDGGATAGILALAAGAVAAFRRGRC